MGFGIMAIFLLNIGNTHTELGLRASGRACRWKWLGRWQTAELLAGRAELAGVLESAPGAPILAACVAPAAGRRLRASFPRRPLVFLRPEHVRDVDFSRVDPATLGADRVANVCGALEVTAPPFLVLDAGTALTLEAVDEDGRFRGGAIAPGRLLMRRALAAGTALLPEIPIEQGLPAALGRNTAAAIRAGVDLGFLGMAARIIQDARAELDSDCPVLCTGGDARFCLEGLTGRVPGLRAAPPHLALLGLAAVAGRLFCENADPARQIPSQADRRVEPER